MKNLALIFGGIALTGLLLGTGIALSDGGREHEAREYEANEHGGWWERLRRDVAPVDNPQYAEECGGCHFAYPPGLLPAASWERLMANLGDHFGDNAELIPETRSTLTEYLLSHAADHSDYRRSRGIAASTAGASPLRISETPYFRRKHDEIPERLVLGNRDVRSWSNCTACHRDAGRGSFGEHGVEIPGVGRWDD